MTALLAYAAFVLAVALAVALIATWRRKARRVAHPQPRVRTTIWDGFDSMEN